MLLKKNCFIKHFQTKKERLKIIEQNNLNTTLVSKKQLDAKITTKKIV